MSELREKLMKIERKDILEKLNLSGTDDITDTLANAPEHNNNIASAPLFQADIIPNSELLQKDPVSTNDLLNVIINRLMLTILFILIVLLIRT